MLAGKHYIERMETTTYTPSPRSVALFPREHPLVCTAGSSCPKAVVEFEGGHLITFGHAGFNSPANNAHGYRSPAAARAAIRHYEAKGRKARAARGGK